MKKEGAKWFLLGNITIPLMLIHFGAVINATESNGCGLEGFEGTPGGKNYSNYIDKTDSQ